MREATVLDASILKVSSFLNHMVTLACLGTALHFPCTLLKASLTLSPWTFHRWTSS